LILINGGDFISDLKISLAAARVNAELSQREVAKMLKVGTQTILNWEKGKVAIPAFQLERLVEIYQIPIGNIRIKKSCTAQNQ
jgi:DNA-binding XRE family transcriptional regulator